MTYMYTVGSRKKATLHINTHRVKSLLFTVEEEIPKQTANNEKYTIVIDKLRTRLYSDVFEILYIPV